MKKIKHSYKAIYLFILLFIASGCEEKFLSENQVSNLTLDFYQTPEGLRSLVNGCYQVFRFKTDYDPGMILFGTNNDCEVFSPNNANRISNGNYAPDAWNASAEFGRVGGVISALLGQESGSITEGMYPVITRCNLFLSEYEAAGKETRSQVSDALGEILFIRAYAYYLLTNVLGEVPLILSTPRGYTNVFHFPKTSLETIYRAMITDLRAAVTLLPDESDAIPAASKVSKMAAAHLLAKLYLHRAQAAEWEESGEPHLAMLYKGKVNTDLDSAIFYASLVIDFKKNQTSLGGLAEDFGQLWSVAANDPSNLSQNYTRDLVSETILSTQYEGTQQFNGRYRGATLIHYYNSDFTHLNCGVSRASMEYPRPFKAAMTVDWAYDMYTDKANDSRFYKTYLHEYASNDEAFARDAKIRWTEETAHYYNTYLKAQFPDRYNGEDAVPGTTKIEFQKRAQIYIENRQDEPLDSLWVASQPYLLLARWVAGSPDGQGYYDYDLEGNITGLKSEVNVDPANPVVSDVSNRLVRYRIVPVDGANSNRYGSDADGTASTLMYLSTRKWWDKNRGMGTDDRGVGAIDIPIIRLAETYLIRAEALGRKSGPAAALDDLNVIRRRAAFKPNEIVNDIVAKDPGVLSGRLNIEVDSLGDNRYSVRSSTYDRIAITGEEWGSGPKAQLENYPPTATTEMDKFIHFIYNEKAREFIFEQMITEDLHNAGIWYERVYYRDYYGAPSGAEGTSDFPFPVDPIDRISGTGATGKGRGLLSKHHSFKPWPLSYLQLLTDEEGILLDSENLSEYQNPGYR